MYFHYAHTFLLADFSGDFLLLFSSLLHSSVKFNYFSAFIRFRCLIYFVLCPSYTALLVVCAPWCPLQAQNPLPAQPLLLRGVEEIQLQCG